MLKRLNQMRLMVVLGALATAVLCAPGAWAQRDDARPEPAAPVEEPTEEQIRAAYAGALEDINARSVAHLGAEDAAAFAMALEDLTKLGCRGLGRPGAHFDCRVERRIRRGEHTPVTDVVQLWLTYEDDRWVAR